MDLVSKPTQEDCNETQSRRNNQSRHWWEQHYQRWQHSGLTKAVYCRQEKINEKNFYNWSKKFRDETEQTTPVSKQSFIPVHVNPETSATLQVQVADVTLKITGNISSAELSAWIRSIRESL